jgi:hypothetical protein
MFFGQIAKFPKVSLGFQPVLNGYAQLSLARQKVGLERRLLGWQGTLPSSQA